MMNAVYFGVILVFIVILCRRFLPRAFHKIEKEKKLSPMQDEQEIYAPCYKVLGFNSEEFMFDSGKFLNAQYFGDVVGNKLNETFEELIKKDYKLSCQIEYVIIGSSLFIFLHYLDKRILYSDVQKGDEKK